MEEYRELLKKVKKPTPPPYGYPWNPSYIIICSIFLPFIATSIGLAINWRRLGKTQWALPTLLVGILGTVILVLGLVFGIRLFDFSSRLSSSLFAFIFAIPLAFFVGVTYLQSVAYQKWRQSHDMDELVAHQYQWRNGFLVMVGVVFVTVAFANWKFDPKTPKVFQGSQFSLEYDSGWEPLDKKVCNFDCELVLGDASLNYTTILFEQFPLNNNMSSKALYQSIWPQILANNPTYKVVDMIDDLKVDGRDAVYVEYYEVHDDGKNQNYFGQYFIAVGEIGIVITVQSDIPGIYREDRKRIEEVVNSIKFTNGSKAA